MTGIVFSADSLEVAWSPAVWAQVLSGDDILSGTTANETFDGGGGVDTIDYSLSATAGQHQPCDRQGHRPGQRHPD